MVCAGFTSERDDVEITDLSPLCLEGRVVYAAPFDPARARQSLPSAPDRALTSGPRSPASAPDKRLFLIGIAAGVIAALALGSNNSHS
jgi:hypothetical protein